MNESRSRWCHRSARAGRDNAAAFGRRNAGTAAGIAEGAEAAREREGEHPSRPAKREKDIRRGK